ncbi:DUF1707 domain-containing protein [Streptomyces sp. VRA16 Mangrove soil]|uniref:DUF1707 SHOCT-like domain-containing protein n=1 Tax=Streptomyces sp. VRA16 Mangrove soil TaxID=2817434 RepID=UPI001A9EBC58|nr:DUF1707 domain-containing protein [Streptomyces sp. VRA16 Mangrove soil]MBO1334633.1 DUF1707 and DUF2154 domain-containing protein [Streptomyces sp. VRA16 Mangrove soil]
MDLQKRPSQPAPSAPTADPTVLRASDADRDRIADILREALAEGRLDADEHAERIDRVYRAKTVGELEPLVRDLPGVHAARPTVVSPAPDQPAPGTVPPLPGENLVAVFSSTVRRGRWRVGRRTHAYAVFGSVEIDLSEAIFEYPQVYIKAVSVFGSVEIKVPENISLRGSGGGILGSFEVDAMDAPEAEAPVVYVDGVAVLGSIEARPRRGKVIANLEKHLRKHFG